MKLSTLFRRFLHERDLFREIYRVGRLLLLLLFLVWGVEKFIFTTVKISEDNRLCSLKKGNHFTVWRRNRLKRHENSFYYYKNFLLSAVVAGVPGEKIKLINGEFFANNEFFPKLSYKTDFPLDANYSPRDNISSFYLPKKGEKISVDSTISSICRFYRIVKQEKSEVEIIPRFFIDGVEQDMLFIKNFVLYKGLLSTISSEQKSSPHFWNSLLIWYSKNRKGVPKLILSVRVGGDEISEYKVKNSYYYLLNREHTAFDSRYCGAISQSKISGVIGWKLPFYNNKAKSHN